MASPSLTFIASVGTSASANISVTMSRRTREAKVSMFLVSPSPAEIWLARHTREVEVFMALAALSPAEILRARKLQRGDSMPLLSESTSLGLQTS